MGRRKSSAASGLAALFILCVASLALFTVYVKEGDCAKQGGCGPLHTVQLGAAEVLQPVRSVFATVFEPVRSTGERVMGAFDNSEEQQAPEKSCKKPRPVRPRRRAWSARTRELRELLEGQRAYYEYGPLAQVVAPVGDQFTQRIVINVGTEDGVEPNRPVVIGESTLIGRTTEVSNHTAQVMLVTDQMFAAGVRIIPPSEFDPASGEISPAVTAEGRLIRPGSARDGPRRLLRGRPGEPRAPAPRRATTWLPAGGPGTRSSCSRLDCTWVRSSRSARRTYDQFKKIVVEPAMDPQDLEEVRVITDWAGRNG